MRYAVVPFFNARPLAMLEGYADGDTLTPSVLVLQVDADEPLKAADIAYAALNQDDRPNGQEERSLSVGDVVRVTTADADVYLAAELVGWREVAV